MEGGWALGGTRRLTSRLSSLYFFLGFSSFFPLSLYFPPPSFLPFCFSAPFPLFLAVYYKNTAPGMWLGLHPGD